MGTLILLIVGIILILVNYRSLKKENNNSFENSLSYAAKNITDYDLELIKLRKEFAETILELQNEIENIKDKLDINNQDEELVNIHDNKKQIDNEKFYEEEINDEFDEDEIEIIEDNEDISNELQQSNNIKVKEIEKLLQNGLSIDLICEKLGIGKGEVLLIEKLYLK